MASPSSTVRTTARSPDSTTCRSSSSTELRFGAGRADAGVERLDEDVDLAAAGKADLERHVVGDAVGQKPRRRPGQNVLRREHDVRLDAAPGDGAGELAALAHDELRADGARRRLARGDDRGDCDLLPAGAPAVDIGQELLHRGFNGTHA